MSWWHKSIGHRFNWLMTKISFLFKENYIILKIILTFYIFYRKIEKIHIDLILKHYVFSISTLPLQKKPHFLYHFFINIIRHIILFFNLWENRLNWIDFNSVCFFFVNRSWVIGLTLGILSWVYMVSIYYKIYIYFNNLKII